MTESIYTIISRVTAKKQGLKLYYTGQPCKHGHISTRYVSNNICVDCQSKSNKQHWNGNSEKLQKQHRDRLITKRAEYNKNHRILYATDATVRNKVKSRVQQWYIDHKDQILNDSRRKTQMTQYRLTNKEHIKYLMRRWRFNNKEYLNKCASAYRKTHRAYYNAQWAKYHASKLQATPTWYEKQQIEILYETSQQLTVDTGIAHEVDHIVPLQGKTVCGLHCIANLQIISMVENRRKSNKLLIK